MWLPKTCWDIGEVIDTSTRSNIESVKTIEGEILTQAMADSIC
jgi:hypothetical protein